MEKINHLARKMNWTKTREKCGAGADPPMDYLQAFSIWGLILGCPKHWPWRWYYLNVRQIRREKDQQSLKRKIVWRQRQIGRMHNYEKERQQ